MLLKSSLLLLLCLNLLNNNLDILIIIFFTVVILNIIFNKNKIKYIGRFKILIFFYISTFFVQLFYAQEGKVILKFYNFYITEEGVLNFAINFIRIINLVLLSWLVNELNIFKNKFKKYQDIIDTVIDLIPEVFTLFKKRMKLRYFYKYIIKKVKYNQKKSYS